MGRGGLPRTRFAPSVWPSLVAASTLGLPLAQELWSIDCQVKVLDRLLADLSLQEGTPTEGGLYQETLDATGMERLASTSRIPSSSYAQNWASIWSTSLLPPPAPASKIAAFNSRKPTRI